MEPFERRARSRCEEGLVGGSQRPDAVITWVVLASVFLLLVMIHAAYEPKPVAPGGVGRFVGCVRSLDPERQRFLLEVNGRELLVVNHGPAQLGLRAGAVRPGAVEIAVGDQVGVRGVAWSGVIEAEEVTIERSPGDTRSH
jgi:hypothetical protein